MSRKRKTPLQRLSELIHEVGLEWVKQSVEIFCEVAAYSSQKQTTLPQVESGVSKHVRKPKSSTALHSAKNPDTPEESANAKS